VRHGGSGPVPRELPPRGLRARNIYDPHGHIDPIKVRTRDFR
jgi:error-prone DNA polymerase